MTDHSKFEEKFDDIPLQELHHLPVQPTGMTYHSTDSNHADRMNELLNRPAVPPPFPTRLPPRPPKQSPNKWMLLSILLLITLIATVTPLTTLLVLSRSKQPPQLLQPQLRNTNANNNPTSSPQPSTTPQPKRPSPPP